MVKLKDTGERLIPEGHNQTLTYGEHISRYISVLELCRGKLVADIASGSGYGTKMIASVAESVIGIDYSDAAIKYSSKNYISKNIQYKVADATKTGLKDSSVDVVVSLETIEHLSDPSLFILEVKRILKKDGIFIVSTPNDAEFMDGNEFHIHDFNFNELQTLISQNFKKNKYYFQGTWFSTGIFDETDFTHLDNKKVVNNKTFQQSPSTAIYFIAVASDNNEQSLDLVCNNVLSDIWSTKRSIEDGKRAEEGINEYKKVITSTEKQLHNIEKELSRVQQEARIINNSPEMRIGRKIAKPLRAIKRKVKK